MIKKFSIIILIIMALTTAPYGTSDEKEPGDIAIQTQCTYSNIL